MIRTSIEKAACCEDICEPEMMETMNEIMEGDATPAQIGALLMALRMKGETVAEITAAAKVMRSKSTRIPLPDSISEPLVDTCGTGGDCAHTFNVSTTAAFVVAGVGAKVAKHGNRSVSSRCGSADLMEELGLPLDLSPEQVGMCIDQIGLGFLYAPALHGAMKYAIGPRREIGLRTIFNLLGPLTNPAGASVQVMGVYSADLVEPLGHVLANLGAHSAFVVHGHGGLDEISLSGPTVAARVKDGKVTMEQLNPTDLGLASQLNGGITGGDVKTNARMTRSVLGGEAGPHRDITVFNAAAALVAAGLASDFRDGMALACESIDSGRAMAKLSGLIEFSSSLKKGGGQASV